MMAIRTNYLQGGLFGNNSLGFISRSRRASLSPISNMEVASKDGPNIITTIETQLDKVIDRISSSNNIMESVMSNSC